MAVTVNDKFSKAKRKFSTTVGAGGVAVGGSSLPLASVTGLPTDTPVVAIINPGGTTEEVVKGVVSGLNLTSLQKGLSGTTDGDHIAGEAVAVYVTEKMWNDMVDGILAQHTASGAHGAVTATSVTTTGDAVIGGNETVAGTLGVTGATSITGALSVTAATAGINASVIYDSTDRIRDYIKPSTGVVAISSGLIGTFSDITYYIGGQRYTKTGIPNKTYTASKDTYVDINTSGTVSYNEVANAAAAPALSANSVRVAKVITSGAAITSVAQTGSISATSSTTTNTDSLGNAVYPGAFMPRFYSDYNDATVAAATSATDMANTSWTFTAERAGWLEFHAAVVAQENGVAPATDWQSQILVDGAVKGHSQATSSTANDKKPLVINGIVAVAAGSHTIKLQTWASSTTMLFSGRHVTYKFIPA